MTDRQIQTGRQKSRHTQQQTNIEFHIKILRQITLSRNSYNRDRHRQTQTHTVRHTDRQIYHIKMLGQVTFSRNS